MSEENLENQEVVENNEVVNQEPCCCSEKEDTCCTEKPKKKYNPCMIATGVLAGLSFIGVIIILCMMFFCNGSCKTSDATATAPRTIQKGELKIAYIDTDSIMAHYEYAKDLEKGLKSLQTQLESNYEATGRKLKADYENYMKTGEKLTLTEQKRKEEDLTRRQQEFPMLQQKMMAQLQERQVEDNKKLLNSVYAFIKDYNAKNLKYNVILSRSYISSSVLYADQGLDITKEIVEGLNKEYKEVKGK